MKLTTFLAPDATTPTAGEVRDDQVVAFTDAASIKDRLAEGSGPADGECWPLAGVTLLAPVQSPGAIYCVALNYKRHIEETGFKAPDRPFIFLKQPGSSVPGNGTARRPSIVQKLDYEGELAVVIGAGGRVGGYAVANDLSARDLQRVEPHWTRAKGADDFCPWGPWVTTADEVSDPENLTLRTWVNGELRQELNTDDLMFGIDELIAFVQETNALQPGDLLLTGTGAGIGESFDPPRFLQPGDTVRIAIESLGEIEHQIVEP